MTQLLGNPFRETGPPANMAKLILLRHKVRQCGRAVFQPPLQNPYRFKQVVGKDAAHLHDVLHGYSTWFPARSRLGYDSAGLLEENNFTNFSPPSVFSIH